jgi:hypothetical protein
MPRVTDDRPRPLHGDDVAVGFEEWARVLCQPHIRRMLKEDLRESAKLRRALESLDRTLVEILREGGCPCSG